MFLIKTRKLIYVTGKNAKNFLERLITAKVSDLKVGDFTFSALLNAKSRFLYDFFLYNKGGDTFEIEIDKNEAKNFLNTLKGYDLLNEVEIKIDEKDVYIEASEEFLTNWKSGIFKGRNITLSLNNDVEYKNEESYNIERIKLCLPNGATELIKEKSFIMEYGYEDAGAISFDKGCYIGQELITRTKHLGEVRKRLCCIEIENSTHLKPKEELENGLVVALHQNYALLLWKKDEIINGTVFLKRKIL